MGADAALHGGHLLRRAVRSCRAGSSRSPPVTSTSTIAPGSAAPSTFTVTFWRVRPRSSRAVAAGALDEDLGARGRPSARATASASSWVSAMSRSTRSRLTSSRQLAGQVGGGGAVARREDEREGRVERAPRCTRSSVAAKSSSVSPGKAGDEVGGDAHVRHRRAQRAHALQVLGGGVAAVHGREHAVGAGLRRQVHVLAHARQLRDGAHQLVGEVLGVRGHEAHAARGPGRRPGRAAAPGSPAPPPRPARRRSSAVGVDVLAEQGDLADAVGGEVAHLGHHGLRLAAALGPAHVGHDAVRAEVGAAAT